VISNSVVEAISHSHTSSSHWESISHWHMAFKLVLSSHEWLIIISSLSIEVSEVLIIVVVAKGSLFSSSSHWLLIEDSELCSREIISHWLISDVRTTSHFTSAKWCSLRESRRLVPESIVVIVEFSLRWGSAESLESSSHLSHSIISLRTKSSWKSLSVPNRTSEVVVHSLVHSFIYGFRFLVAD